MSASNSERISGPLKPSARDTECRVLLRLRLFQHQAGAGDVEKEQLVHRFSFLLASQGS